MMRFRAVIDRVRQLSTVDAMAADDGDGAQAHLSYEFRGFADVTSTAFMAACGPCCNHLPLDGPPWSWLTRRARARKYTRRES